MNSEFSKLAFYEKFIFNDLYLDGEECDYKIDKEKQLLSHYELKKLEKISSDNSQIERAKWKNVVKAHGEMVCEGGHSLSDSVACNCNKESLLYWVDGDTQHTICNKCNDVSVLGLKLICNACKKPSKCITKLVTGYRP